ncbi:hypothetical protein [Trichlorobacter lovleyi]|uniref:hypothetical protein n=1 Tax=Trichlorobacter lovleyi TaxID=313985 RepID=UPI0024804783|nr:hypothetical protein [Trichlorobacter lovleyi]
MAKKVITSISCVDPTLIKKFRQVAAVIMVVGGAVSVVAASIYCITHQITINIIIK